MGKADMLLGENMHKLVNIISREMGTLRKNQNEML